MVPLLLIENTVLSTYNSILFAKSQTLFENALSNTSARPIVIAAAFDTADTHPDNSHSDTNDNSQSVNHYTVRGLDML